MNANHFKQRIACRYFRAPQKIHRLALSFEMRSKFTKVQALLQTQKHKLFRRRPKASADINLEDASIESIMKGDEPVTVADMDKATNISLADPALLEKIDKLFELNIGEDVALPQVRLW